MSTKESEKPQNHLSVDDLEAALSLLSSEASMKPLDRRKALITAIADIAVCVMFFGILHGLVTLFFSLKWGLLLLGLAVVAFLITGAAASSPHHLPDITKKFRGAIANTKFDQAAGLGWKTREVSPFLVIPVVLAFVLSLAGLAYGCLVQNETIVIITLVVGVLSAVISGVYFAIDENREFQYFSAVSALQEDFQTRLSDLGSDKRVAISLKEKELLSQIEQQHVNRRVAKALENWDEGAQAFYSIALSPLVLKQLQEFPEHSRNKLREVIDSLQITPRPQNARLIRLKGKDVVESATQPADLYRIKIDEYRITYRITDEKLRVDVTDVGAHNTGGDDAS